MLNSTPDGQIPHAGGGPRPRRQRRSTRRQLQTAAEPCRSQSHHQRPGQQEEGAGEEAGQGQVDERRWLRRWQRHDRRCRLAAGSSFVVTFLLASVGGAE